MMTLAGGPVHAAPQVAFDRVHFDQEHKGMDLRPYLEYAIVPETGVLDPDKTWQADSTSFKPMKAGQRLEIPSGSMMLARVELKVMQVRDPDYLQFPSSRLDRVRLWARAEGQPWQTSEAGDRVPLSHWPFAGPFPAFELPDGSERVQIVLAIEHRGSLNLPMEWHPDSGFRAARLAHAFTFGSIAGLAAALVLVCALALGFFRRSEFFALGVYTLMTGLSLSASNGYAGVYLWPESPVWNDASKGVLGMILTSLLLPLIGQVLRLPLHRPAWWKACWRWAIAGLVYASLQAVLLPPEWRTIAGLLYVASTLLVAFALVLHDVLRGDAMSRLTLLALFVISMGTVLGYSDLFDVVNELWLHIANAASRLGFVVLILIVAAQRHRYGRDVLSRLMAGSNRDSLTGFANRAGIKQELARETLLLDDADSLQSGILICDLQNIAVLRADLGDEACDRILVRLAHVLTSSVQGHGALLGRLSAGRFAVVALRDVTHETVQAMATRILSRMLAQNDLPNAVREMKLRIVMKLEPLSSINVDGFEEAVTQQFRSAGESRTIRWIEKP
ncbi:MAG: diguanylate cyclase [Pseudomonadota bacterium]